MQTCLAGGRVVLNSLSLSPFLLRAHPPGDSLCCFWATQRRKDITSYPIKYPYIKASINFFFLYCIDSQAFNRHRLFYNNISMLYFFFGPIFVQYKNGEFQEVFIT